MIRNLGQDITKPYAKAILVSKLSSTTTSNRLDWYARQMYISFSEDYSRNTAGGTDRNRTVFVDPNRKVDVKHWKKKHRV